jgi:hypothetical protein
MTLMLHQKLVEKQEPKTSRSREIIKIMAEISEIETKNMLSRIKKIKN